MGEKLVFSSWANERLPEMLWAALLVGGLERERALAVLRDVGFAGRGIHDETRSHDITFTGITELPDGNPRRIVGLICEDADSRHALSPLLLLEDLPGSEMWREALADVRTEAAWEPLMRAVGLTLFHQSEEATDCRWVRALFPIACGKVHFTKETVHVGREIWEYPNGGQQEKVRPIIRASESQPNPFRPFPTAWAASFWDQCLRNSTCISPGGFDHASSTPAVGVTRSQLSEVYDDVVSHFHRTRNTTAIDPKHDTVFGTALYVLSIVRELLGIGVSTSIVARMGLRSIFEAFVTLAYLAERDDPQLWRSYRVYGAGQAKLALLKLEVNPIPDDSFVSHETLEGLANEDAWEEFLEINLGHWDSTTLRDLSIKAHEKEAYDRYFIWPSSFVHAHWGAIRDSVLETCFNPLHRLHRIPRQSARLLPDVLPSCSLLANRVLNIVGSLYPGLEKRL